jgi:hypothetical protein
MCTETKRLSKNQQKKLIRRKKPKLLDSKSLDINDDILSPPPKCEALPEQLTPSPYPPSQDPPYKRDIDDEIQIDQPTSKQPRHRSPSQNPSSSLEPQQPQSPPLNDEDSDPPPILTNDGKRQQQQQQQDDIRDNKKQKHQENATLLTTTETPFPQLIKLSDYVPTPTDSLLENLAIPTPPQIIPQAQITESTTNETTTNYTNQEQTTTRTRGFKHHSPSILESPSESPSQELPLQEPMTSTTMETPTQSQTTPSKPPNWSGMSKTQRRHWLHRQLGKK